MNREVCAKASAAGRCITEKPPRMRFGKTDLVAMLQRAGVDPKNISSIRHLGNRIVLYNAGHRLVLTA